MGTQQMDMTKKAMEQQGVNMPTPPPGVGPQFPDPSKYKKGGATPGTPTTTPPPGGGTEQKNN
jgi:hypothetical protein